MREQVIGKLGKAAAAARSCHPMGGGGQAAGKFGHVGNAHRVWKIAKHRRVVGAVADEDNGVALALGIEAEFIGQDFFAGGELVIGCRTSRSRGSRKFSRWRHGVRKF